MAAAFIFGSLPEVDISRLFSEATHLIPVFLVSLQGKPSPASQMQDGLFCNVPAGAGAAHN